MKPYNPRREGIPDKIAYFDGENHLCEERLCYIDGVILEECGILPINEARETPILRCPECGKLYFGNTRRPITPSMNKKQPEPNAMLLQITEELPKVQQVAETPHQPQFEGITLPNLLTV